MMKRIRNTMIITIGMILFLFVISRAGWYEDHDTRNANRDRKVNENVIDRMASRLVIPTKAEGFDEIIVIWERLSDYEKK